MADAVPPLESGILEGLCRELGELVTGSEITRLLAECGMEDPLGFQSTKWRRLFEAFAARQARDRSANGLLPFVRWVLDPVRYRQDPRRFDVAREGVNEVLRFVGVRIDAEGRFYRTAPDRTVSVERQRARRLQAILSMREIHPDVLAACGAEIREDNYFHAVLEAAKSLAEKVRKKSGLDLDGVALIQAAFEGATPLLALNRLQTETERGEQRGFANLMKGVFGAFRNPTAHELRTSWRLVENDALEVLGMLSLLHRRVDGAVTTRPWVGQPSGSDF